MQLKRNEDRNSNTTVAHELRRPATELRSTASSVSNGPPSPHPTQKPFRTFRFPLEHCVTMENKTNDKKTLRQRVLPVI